MPMNKRVYAILNPASGRGKSSATGRAVGNALAQARLDHQLVETLRPNHAIDLARDARSSGFGVVAAVGGDGTVSEVVNGLYRSAVPGRPVGRLAMFPAGSGNDFVDMLGAPKSPGAVVERILRGHVKHVDLGVAGYRAQGDAHSRVFDNNLGVGFEAQVTLESYKIRRLKGTLLYVWAALRALRSYAAPQMTIEWEDAQGKYQKRELETLLVTIGNSARTGGGFYLTPQARLDDGLLDIAIARHLPRHRILGLLPKALFGKHTTDPAVEMATCRWARIVCHEPSPMHMDGEVLTQDLDQVEVQVDAGRLQVIV